MNRRPTLLVLAASLLVAGLLVSLVPRSRGGVLVTSAHAESSALYCSGLTSSQLGAQGTITIRNLSNSLRHLEITVHSDDGKSSSQTAAVHAGDVTTIQPDSLATGHAFGVDIIADGPGLAAVESTREGHATAPCVASGSSKSLFAGLSTVVGTDTYLNLYNPTATPAVTNLSVYTASGFSAPTALQGITVAGHALYSVELGSHVVNTSNFAVLSRVVHGQLLSVATMTGGSLPSLITPTTTTRKLTLPAVTTADQATSVIQFANTSDKEATVTAKFSLGDFQVAPQTVQVLPFSTASLTVSPNSAIPAAGNAIVSLTSTAPVGVSLGVGTQGHLAVTSPPRPRTSILIGDVYGDGFDFVTVLNPNSVSVSLTVRSLGGAATRRFEIQPGHSVALTDGGPWGSVAAETLQLTSTNPGVIVTGAWKTQPAGIGLITGY